MAQSRAGEINIGNKYFRLCKVISSFKKKILNLLCHVGGVMLNKIWLINFFIIKLFIVIFKKIKFNDKYGLSYYLWSNTRPIDTYQRKVRTDDETLIELVLKVINVINNDKKPLVCFDIGGYIGVITLAMLKNMKNKGMVHVFEPVRVNYYRICENLKLNNYSNVVVNNFAISDYSGLGLQNITVEGGNEFLQKLHDHSGEISGDELSESEANQDVKEQQITMVMSLMNYMDLCSIDWVDVVKIDAESIDHLVLNGGKQYFYEQKFGFIFVEYNHGSYCSSELLRMLNDAKYDVYYIVRNAGTLVSNLSDYPSGYKTCLNILAISNLVEADKRDKILSGVVL